MLSEMVSDCPLPGCPLDTGNGCGNSDFKALCAHMAETLTHLNKKSNYSFDYMITKLITSTECEVLFDKVDGSERFMRCTLNPSRLAHFLKEKEVADKDYYDNQITSENHDYITVWDLDKNSWRRFRVDSVKNFQELF